MKQSRGQCSPALQAALAIWYEMLEGNLLPPVSQKKSKPVTVPKEYPNKNPVHGNITADFLSFLPYLHPKIAIYDETSQVICLDIRRFEWSFGAWTSKPQNNQTLL